MTHNAGVRLQIRVRPGAGRIAVGGNSDGSLVVRVTARAVDGLATEAALAALADALGVRRRQDTLVSGRTSRTKLIDVEGVDAAVVTRLLDL